MGRTSLLQRVSLIGAGLVAPAASAQFLGTTNNQPLEIRVNNQRALRVEPSGSPNLIGGHRNNSVYSPAYGATIAGGGSATSPNRITDLFGTIGGGEDNLAGDEAGNDLSAIHATVGGGLQNRATTHFATISGGFQNTASGGSSATVAGGHQNTASGQFATVCGGHDNTAAGDRSFAAGGRAKAMHDGAFVWCDGSTGDDFGSTGPNQFLIQADGGVGIGTNNPQFQLHLSQNSAAKPGSSVWTIFSDRRLKKNIEALTGSLDKLLQLRGVEYEWIDPDSQGGMAGRYAGMIAQDVERVFPEWIAEGRDAFKTLTVIGFEGLAVEALRDLRTEKDRQIQELTQELKRQRNQNEAMADRVAQLEALIGRFLPNTASER